MSILQHSAIGLLLCAAGAAFILLVSRPDIQDFAVMSFYWLLLAGSWNLLAGFGGQFSFAHVTLALSGGYFSVLLERVFQIPAIHTLVPAGLVCALVGGVLGLISLRVRGIYLSL